jgi:hypothetical protein
MKKLVLLTALTALFPLATFAANIIAFGTMYGVDGPFVGHTQIRNVRGDEQPWAVGSASGYLTSDGHLVINVTGIVFAPGAQPPSIVGTNDEATFRGLVSCLVENKNTVSTVNISTAGFPATTSGNSNIDAHITLPPQCVAPIIFVMSGSEDKWFAVTGKGD